MIRDESAFISLKYVSHILSYLDLLFVLCTNVPARNESNTKCSVSSSMNQRKFAHIWRLRDLGDFLCSFTENV